MARLPRTGYLIFTFGLLSLAARVYAEPTGRPTPMIRGPVDETKLVVLEGNTRPEANAKNDRGIVSDEFPLEHMMLQLIWFGRHGLIQNWLNNGGHQMVLPMK